MKNEFIVSKIEASQDEKTPFVYVVFSDTKTLGKENQQQQSQRQLEEQRRQIEALQQQKQHPQQQQEDLTQKLKKYGELKQQGLITEEEFQKLKADLLSKI